MFVYAMIQAVLFFGLLLIICPLLGKYIYKVFSGEMLFLDRAEKSIIRFAGIDSKEMDWKRYAASLLFLNLSGFILLFLFLILQDHLPLNPHKLPSVSIPLAFNTAVSFVTNTNWQAYGGEVTLSYFVQMAGLTVQNFLSAATGMAVFFAIARGLVRKDVHTLGNFWVDIVRTVIYILLPLSIIFAIALLSQGVIQSFGDYVKSVSLEGKEQLIPLGPVSSQLAIKQIGTNGGGFFNTNSAHPFENPTPFSNLLEMIAIILIPAALPFTYGKMTGSKKEGRVIFIVMFTLLLTGLILSLYSEYNYSVVKGIDISMEGKETRFGIFNSMVWTACTTAASNGSVNTMIDSMTPLSGMVAMLNIMSGEVIFGGVGSGMYGIIMFILITVFIAGLMIGRSPEFLGKKIEAFEVKMAMTAILIPNFVILVFSALGCITPAGLSGLNNHGPHGLSEIVYCFSSAAGNNGSSFAGLNANTLFYNLLTGAGMLLGRFGIIIPVLAVAGNMAIKKVTPSSAGTLRTDTLLFGSLVVFVIIIVGGLTFFPVLSFGPVIEHLMLTN